MNAQTDVRRHILEVGQQLIQAKGFVAVGLSELLAAAAVPKGSFYYYFASKDAFGQALLEYYFAGYLETVRQTLRDPALTGAARLLRYVELWVSNQCGCEAKAKCLVVKLAGEVADLSEAMRAVLKAGTDATIAEIAACIRAGLADGSLTEIADPDAVATALYEYKLGASLLGKVRRDGTAFAGSSLAIRQLLHV